MDVKTREPQENFSQVDAGIRGRRRRRGLLVLITAAVIIIAAIAGWSVFSVKAPVYYVTSPVARGDVSRSVTATGTLNPILTIIVGSYVSGVIRQVFCDYNAVVKAGQVCAKIDPGPYQAALDQYNGQLLRDQGLLEEAQVDLQRYQKLARESSIALQQVEDQSYLVQQDEGTVKLDEGLVENAELNLKYTDIVSPVDGTVVSRNVSQGQTVASSYQTPTLFLIGTNLKQMEVDTNVSESDVGNMKVGDQADFTVDAYPNRIFQGVVSQVRVSPQEVQNVVTYDAIIYVDNADLALMPGMTAATQIVVNQRKKILRIPDQALRYEPGGLAGPTSGTPMGGQGRVWVLRNNHPVGVTVGLGLDDGSFTEIVEGDLKTGDQLIIAESRDRTGAPTGSPRSHP